MVSVFNKFLLWYLIVFHLKLKTSLIFDKVVYEYDKGYIKDLKVFINNPSTNKSTINLYIVLHSIPVASTKISVRLFEEVKGTYKQFGRTLEHNLCSYLKTDKLFYPGFLKYSTFPKSCPIQAGNYTMTDYKVPIEDFPVTLQKGKWIGTFQIKDNDIIILSAEHFCSIIKY